jgi:hypothetical protein
MLWLRVTKVRPNNGRTTTSLYRLARFAKEFRR